jgi:hypothetical protein
MASYYFSPVFLVFCTTTIISTITTTTTGERLFFLSAHNRFFSVMATQTDSELFMVIVLRFFRCSVRGLVYVNEV